MRTIAPSSPRGLAEARSGAAARGVLSGPPIGASGAASAAARISAARGPTTTRVANASKRPIRARSEPCAGSRTMESRRRGAPPRVTVVLDA